MFGAVIGGIITVVVLKLREMKEAALATSGARKKSDKQPTEHDERY